MTGESFAKKTNKTPKYNDYAISLDIGNGSCGWCAIEPNYRLLRLKGKNAIGVRLFDPAQTAAKRRGYRAARRRLSRRRWRLRLLNEIFAEEINKIDKNFFARQRYSWVHKDDENNRENWYGSSLFGDKKRDIQFHKDYPTVYHLREKLMNDDEKHDLREIYFAIHHILKYRGHFITEGKLEAATEKFETRDVENLFKHLYKNLCKSVEKEYSEYKEDSDSDEIIKELDLKKFTEIICNFDKTKAEREEEANKCVTESAKFKSLKKEDKCRADALEKLCAQIIKALFDRKCDFSNILGYDAKDNSLEVEFKFNISAEGKIDALYEAISEEECVLIEEIESAYSKFTLMKLLGDCKTVSESMIAKYDLHKEQLKFVKQHFANTAEDKKEFKNNYRAIIGIDEEKNDEEKDKAAKKDKPVKKDKAVKYFGDKIWELYKKQNPEADDKAKTVKCFGIFTFSKGSLEDNSLFPVQRGTDNGVIPHQLHLIELQKIIEKQGKYYDFLREAVSIKDKDENKLECLLKFRVPYYVGPLVSRGDMNSGDNSENHWMVRKNNETITPFNFYKVVDTSASAEKFIKRLTGTDSYLLGEPTLPKNSLLYQEYEVLSEINNIRKIGNNSRERLNKNQKDAYYKLFKNQKKVTKSAALNKAELEKDGDVIIDFTGLSKETEFASSLSSYHDLKKVFEDDFIWKNRDLMEKIIEIQTVFEDKDCREEQLRNLKILNEQEISQLSKIHYTGWGRFSKKLLSSKVINCNLKNDRTDEKHSVIEILRDQAVNFMEILTDRDNGFQEWIEDQNKLQKDKTVNDLIDNIAADPKVKRGVKQSIAVIDDIIKANNGKAPERIFLEMADDPQPGNEITESRSKRINKLYENCKDIPDYLKKQLNDYKNRLSDKRYALYFLQQGKDMYDTEKSIDIEKISSHYDVDHIIPRALTTNNSLDNLVLVSRAENARKSKAAVLDREIIKKNKGFWEGLLNNKLISQNKFDNLCRDKEYSEKEKKRFVSRSLVETRQIIANIKSVLKAKYPDIDIIGLNSQVTKDMRRYLGYAIKDRDINDYHHAQDAFCLGVAGQFAQNRVFFERGQITNSLGDSYNIFYEKYAQNMKEKTKEGNKVASLGFIVGSMQSENDELKTNKTTGEICWSEEDKNYARKVMGYSKMLVTKQINFDARIISKNKLKPFLFKENLVKRPRPANKTSKLVPSKKNKIVNLYGGYTERQTAYVTVYCLEKDGAVEPARLFSIPRIDIEKVNEIGAKKYIENSKKKKENVVILIERMPVGQLVIVNNHKMTVTSERILTNAQELYLDKRSFDFIHHIINSEKLDDLKNKLQKNQKQDLLLENSAITTELIKSFDILIDCLQKYYPLFPLKKIGSKKIYELSQERFDKYLKSKEFSLENSYEEIHKFFKDLINAMKMGGKRTNLKITNLQTSENVLNYERFAECDSKGERTLADSDMIIYQSATGLFEKRVTVGELKKQKGL